MENWYCIVNPRSGSGKTIAKWDIAREVIKQKGLSFSEVLTERKNHATELAYKAALLGKRYFIAVGGDGTVHEVMNGIMKCSEETGATPESFYLAAISIGSGNDWIKSTGVPNDIEKTVNLLVGKSFIQQDVIKVEAGQGKCYMVNCGGIGFDSHLIQRVNKQKDRGKRSKAIYADSAIRTILGTRHLNGTICADGKVIYDGAFYQVSFGNGSFCGGGMQFVPKANLNDALVDVMIVPKRRIFAILKEFPRVFNGTMPESTVCLTSKGQVLQVKADKNDLVEIDGEIIGNLPLTISVAGSKINVLADEIVS
ncbi:MAG: hypothetical protein KBT04_07520 [Bacteroidales bacterium]|nr:hypothetical protein [Candidatus Colimorpha onthohippi]